MVRDVHAAQQDLEEVRYREGRADRQQPPRRGVLRRLHELSRHRYVSAYNIGVLYAGLGQKDEAFRWLQKVEEDRSEMFAAVNVDPRLDALHSDSRFAAVLRSDDDSPGRKLEFVAQEMGREVNTIGSKAGDTEISRRVVEIKAVMEKVREMLQNVE